LFEERRPDGRGATRVWQPRETRNLVERSCNIKHFRAIATRYEKTARDFFAGVHLVCALAWLK
jgi:transposase